MQDLLFLQIDLPAKRLTKPLCSDEHRFPSLRCELPSVCGGGISRMAGD
jgi:hypothetical protein